MAAGGNASTASLIERARTRWNTAGASSTLRVCYVPWEAEEDWNRVMLNLATRIQSLQHSDYMDVFCAKERAILVFDVNRMEGTISADLREEETVNEIVGYMDGSYPTPPAVPWDSEGGREPSAPSTSRQLYQCAQAVKYLMCDNIDSPLTVELIVQTHKILMEGSFVRERDGRETPVVVGRERRLPGEDVNAGFYQFIPSAAVPAALAAVVERYMELDAALDTHPVSHATSFFYELITVHPFGNGNGRVCRLFLAWSLCRAGFPFPLSFSSGHKGRRQHYLHAINRARKIDGGHRGELNVTALASMRRLLDNYDTNMRLM